MAVPVFHGSYVILLLEAFSLLPIQKSYFLFPSSQIAQCLSSYSKRGNPSMLRMEGFERLYHRPKMNAMGGVPYMLTEQGVGALFRMFSYSTRKSAHHWLRSSKRACIRAMSSTSLESLALSSCSSCSLSSLGMSL